MSRAYKEKKKWRGSCPRSLKYQNRNARRCAPLCPALLRSSPRGVARAYYYDTLTDWVRAFSCHFIGNGWAWPMVNCTSSSSSTSQKPFDTQHSSTARVYWGRVPPRFAVRCAPLSNSSDSASVKRLLILFYFILFHFIIICVDSSEGRWIPWKGTHWSIANRSCQFRHHRQSSIAFEAKLWKRTD